jgi:hypothetical protein
MIHEKYEHKAIALKPLQTHYTTVPTPRIGWGTKQIVNHQETTTKK